MYPFSYPDCVKLVSYCFTLIREKPRVAKILVEKLREPMKLVNGVASSPTKGKLFVCLNLIF